MKLHATGSSTADSGGATDLAAIRYRTQELDATRLLYVVGLPQRQHFEMVHEVAREAGWLKPPARARAHRIRPQPLGYLCVRGQHPAATDPVGELTYARQERDLH